MRGSLAGLPADTTVVVEAVPEDPRLKASVLRDAERTVGAQTVLATNTSSLSVTELAAVLERPQRFLGMHFFNPVPAFAWSSWSSAPDTDRPARDRRGWVDLLGKTGIVVSDSPGFATSRLGVLLGLEAIRMLEEGVADAEAIDTAMELGYRHPMGPLRLDRPRRPRRPARDRGVPPPHARRAVRPPQLLRDKVAAGELGRKTGRGFHDYG